jgi:hypothetical protein
MPKNANGFSAGLIKEILVSSGGQFTLQVTPTTLTVVKADMGRLCRVLVTTVNGANAVLIYDNATTNTGTIIGYIPAAAAVGTIIDFSMPAVNGITIAATVSAGTFTISYD